MPRPSEVAQIRVNGQRYGSWETVAVTRSGLDPFPKFAFTAASPIESAPNYAGRKLKIGDACDVFLGGVQAIANGQITGRQAGITATSHGLQVSGTTRSHVVARASVDHRKGEFKGYNLQQIANAVLAPYKTKFTLKGDTVGVDKIFPKINVQYGEIVFDFIERLCRFRNVYILTDKSGDLVGYRMPTKPRVIAELQEGRNILSGTIAENYTGALSEINVQGQRPGTDQNYGNAARDVQGKVNNSAVKQHIPARIVAEMPGDQADMQARAEHEMGYMIADQVAVSIVVQGWFKDASSLWLEHVGETVSVYAPTLLTNDHMKLAIQEVTSTQATSPGGGPGTLTNLSLVLPEAFNGRGQIDSGSVPPAAYGVA